ncbi:MAG: hypothetical protein WCI18_16775, partial [Pseudomonadota bacterium]
MSGFPKIVAWSCFGILLSCGQQQKNKRQNEEDSTKGELISIPVELGPNSGGLLDLRRADGYSLKVEGCRSGYSGTFTEVTKEVNIYKDDQNCLAKLESITLDGTVYQPVSGSGFQTWQSGDFALFQKVGSADITLRVLVRSQLSSPVLTSDMISYSFSEIKQKDPTTIPSPSVSEPHTITIDGELAPPFQMQLAGFKGINAKGGGLFEFT